MSTYVNYFCGGINVYDNYIDMCSGLEKTQRHRDICNSSLYSMLCSTCLHNSLLLLESDCSSKKVWRKSHRKTTTKTGFL